MVATTRGKNPPRSKPLKPPFPHRALPPPPPPPPVGRTGTPKTPNIRQIDGRKMACFSSRHTHTSPDYQPVKKTYSFPRLSSRPANIAATAAGLCDVKNDDMNTKTAAAAAACCLPPTQPNPTQPTQPKTINLPPTSDLQPTRQPTQHAHIGTHPPIHLLTSSLLPRCLAVKYAYSSPSLRATKQPTHLFSPSPSFCIFNLDPALP